MYLSVFHQRYGEIVFQHIFSFWKISQQFALLLRKIAALLPSEIHSHWIQNYVQCKANSSANGGMPFPFSRCFKNTPTEKKLPTNAQLFNIRRDFGIHAFEHRKLHPCASYGYIQDNIYATTEGVLCPPTQHNFSKEHVCDKLYNFFQVTLPGLQRKTHTMLP